MPDWLVPAAIGTLIALVSILMAYWRGWRWTGFVEDPSHPPDRGNGPRTKTLWDWLELLLVPVVIAAGVALFNADQAERDRQRAVLQARHDEERADARASVDAMLAEDARHEQALQAYLDEMTSLALDRGLGKQTDEAERAADFAETRTLATLRALGDDALRKGQILRFLHDARLITGDDPILSLVKADFSHADLSFADLCGVFLVVPDFTGADLHGADLSLATFLEGDFTQADLSSTLILGSAFASPVLDQTDFSHSNLGAETVLLSPTGTGPTFDGADLRGLHAGMDLVEGASFEGAIVLPDADIRDADLGEAIVREREDTREAGCSDVILHERPSP